jgi:uncharacterized phage protein (TIGR01671 family)
MSRIYLFRGMRYDKAGWVFGDLQQMVHSKLRRLIWDRLENISYLVIIETVGQFTGLLDRIGNKIYEGDILRIGAGIEDGYAEGKVGQVIYSEDHGGFIVEWKWSKNQHYVRLTGDIASVSEIIGNFHDNPEIMNAA